MSHALRNDRLVEDVTAFCFAFQSMLEIMGHKNDNIYFEPYIEEF